MKNKKQYSLAGCCGISCGLCPRFQSNAKSRCLGCGPDGHCSYCSIFRCCQMKNNYETCADCSEFPCGKFNLWFDSDSFVTHLKCHPNIMEIKKSGIIEFIKEQEERRKLLEFILEKYNPGRLMSFYCLASALLSIESLKGALIQIGDIKEDKIKSFEILIKRMAVDENISLKLRKL